MRALPSVRSCFGLDFGYVNDPTALFCGLIDTTAKTLWVFDELYERGMTNEAIAEKVKAMGYAKERITADSAEPKSIDRLKTLGLWNVRPALEGILRIPARSRSEYLEKVQNALSGLFARLGGATEKMVYIPATTQGCELCISRSGRVYCISGKDSRFPPLTDLFPGSYKTIHPNCRCPLVPWYPEQYTPEEMRKAVQESNRSAKVKQDSPALARYKQQQEYNRQIIAEQRDFEAARQKYGAAMPYQSIASYRRAVRAFKKENHGSIAGFWSSKGLTSGAKEPKETEDVLTNGALNDTIKPLVEMLEQANVEYRPVKRLPKTLSVDEIIQRVGGGDLTNGSCSSVALAYCGNRSGLDVLDFRGGDAEKVFSKKSTIEKLAHLPGVESVIIQDTNDIKAALSLIKNVAKGKEYYLGTGKHAAIVRRTSNGLEYLELQDPKENGFKRLTLSELKIRFECSVSNSTAGIKLMHKNILIECSSLGASKDFAHILGFINTSEAEQKKGDEGNAK